ncbi:hypothetical protein [Enterobacter hormaechei]|uniref:hypothetical protein n=1 Tax=Enterobacter hormaechei TaxID=158836 RepID=UPI00202198AA|nr:hypothetical protein [Enterobacter hormaechei]EME7879001.1 hypothetical protein [Enterobacter hormaechei]MCL8077583.1 hypothetical protein [Enterobacter hormaechei]MCM6984366.1 hypothetical protein [Enterobacter hormaechei]MCM7055966.1 hypothetical protein [Enterobacter hormaechei]
MLNYIKRFLRWQGRTFFSVYGPTALTILFAIIQAHFFPGSPVWPVGVFFIAVMIIFGRNIKG